MHKFWYSFGYSCIVSILLSVFPAPGSAIVIERTIAVVGTEYITQTDLDFFAITRATQVNDSTQKILLDNLINDTLLIQIARKEMIDVYDSIVKSETDQRYQHYRSQFPDEETFNKWLKMRMLSVSDLKSIMKNGVYKEKLIYTLLRKKTEPVTDTELQNYLKKYPDAPAKMESVRIRQVLLTVPANATAEEKETIHQKALQVYRELKSGTPFELLVSRYSEDSASKEEGGDLGIIKRGEMLPEIENVAFALKDMEFSEPILTSNGYHIIQVNNRTSVRDAIYQEKWKQTIDKLLKEAKAKTKITIK